MKRKKYKSSIWDEKKERKCLYSWKVTGNHARHRIRFYSTKILFFFPRNYIHVNGKASRNVYTLFSLLLLPLFFSSLFPNQVSEYKFNKLRANGDGRRRWIHLENKLRNAFFMKWMRERKRGTLIVKNKFVCW